MPIWPFKRRRANTLKDGATSLPQQPAAPASAPATATASLGRSMSKRSVQGRAPPPSAPTTPSRPGQRGQEVGTSAKMADKENVRPRQGSREDVTALPSQRKLQSSPHLRRVGNEKTPIPYNFRPQSMSQVSISQQQDTSSQPPRPATLQSKRSTIDYGTPSRRTSVRSRRSRKDDALREEEIRAMSAATPIPKRPGEGLLRRDSKKLRGKASNVTLPADGSIHSSLSGGLEQRGWEVGNFAVFNPRPAVRLSGTTRLLPSSLPSSPSGIMYRIDSIKAKDKTPVTRDFKRKKRNKIGDEADDLDASDLRLILERDAKRRQRKEKEDQEKLDRKLKSSAGQDRGDSNEIRRDRGDSDLRRRDVADELTAETIKARVAEERRARAMTPPTDIHPALRDQRAGFVGAGRAESPSIPEEGEPKTDTYFVNAPPAGATRDPFADPVEVPPFVTPPEERTTSPLAMAGIAETAEGSIDEPFAETAQAVQTSVPNPPPLSPIHSAKSPLDPSQPAASIGLRKPVESPLPSPVDDQRRASTVSDTPTSPRERRAGPWSSLFRRGNTVRSTLSNEQSPAQGSFSNTSRESMRGQPLPAHLVDVPDARPRVARTRSGAPVRTQSKFREDLPESPLSPPDSRTTTPEIALATAAAAAARRHRMAPEPLDSSGGAQQIMAESSSRDTPVSPAKRGHERLMSASMASVDSEGSWLAGGSKRQSVQSALSRSLSQRKAEFSTSYEELGGDKDAEYMKRNSNRASRQLASAVLAGASPDEETELVANNAEHEASTEVVHPRQGSVRRQPTLVKRDARVKSREGLVSEYVAADAGAEVHDDSQDSHDSSDDLDTEPNEAGGAQLQHATSISYAGRHSRQFSAGSARLLDVPPQRKNSVDASTTLDSPIVSSPTAAKTSSSQP